ncbi:TRAP transporter small permease [Comamonadaceae bacterium M7527]|nr:TRAP transporter small permease [Comamonadaceae bacterium M7527]
MADLLTPTITSGDDTSVLAIALEKSAKVFAMLSGLALVGMALMSLTSIVGRTFFDAPVLGDYELVQIACAAAVSLALPYTQWVRGHVIVDFFTAKANVTLVLLLDGIANAILSVFALAFAWRMWVNMVDLMDGWDASLMLNIPTWWGYVPMVPSFLLLGLIAAYHCVADIRSVRA